MRWQHPTQPIKPRQNSEGHPSSDRGTLVPQTNGSSAQGTRFEPLQKRTDTYNSTHSTKSNQNTEAGYLAPARVGVLIRKDSNLSENSSAQDSLLDLYGSNSANRSGMNSMDFGERKGTDSALWSNDEDPESSRWIHRDKLAQIESQELQAAGILLPRPRAQSKSSRRERSRDQQTSGHSRSEQSGQIQKRQRIDPLPTEEAEEAEEEQIIQWDLRRPEEAAEDANSGYRELSSGQKGISRIPVFKTSPLPIPLDYLERDTPIQRNRSNGWNGEEDGIAYPKSRIRSESIKLGDDAATPTPARRAQPDMSPSKKAVVSAARKGSASATRAASAQARPKTRSGVKDGPSSRPPTRSGEPGQSNYAKTPEGDPPWLASMYKPDPRLPPDQQLLPTVAKRLQQEQWEKEGKFGNVYDRDFRPLNDEEFQLPEGKAQMAEMSELRPEEHSEWPLKMPKSPSPSTGRPGTSGGYSTIPKIQDIPPSPMSPRVPPPQQAIRTQEPAEESKQKEGCGCCIVM